MRVVSTVHKAGFDQYGEQWVAGVDNWPKGTEFFLYTEGFDLNDPRITTRRIEDVPRAVKFKEQYAYYKPSAWRWDIVRFSNKVFATYDALYNYDGLAVWLDADAITYAKIPDGYIERMLPPGNYMAMFKRIGMQTETGFWLMDCSNKVHYDFLDTWIHWLESGSFKKLQQWCDASTLDATVRMFEKQGVIKTSSLSGKNESSDHPMAYAPIAEYIDHLKGEGRKVVGESPENSFRKRA